LEVIVLAGGLGTRLQGVIGSQPKCMAIVAGEPFLFHLFTYLTEQKCSRVILSLGFRHEAVTEWLVSTHWPFEISYVVEQEQLGTGGGIALAMKATQSKDIIVINGDTMFRVNLNDMMQFHTNKNAATSVALKEMLEFERYGIVKTNAAQLITSFEEKQYCAKGWINGGTYMINKASFEAMKMPGKFSFEKDYLEAYVNNQSFFGYASDAYFIDIGIPEDYTQAQIDFLNN
jgi:D-glycero-alpha-D-manno-heptose 1-phosphate guanylyltransferase